MLLGGFSSFNPNQLIVKAIRYAATFGLIIYWPEFINNILLSIIETFGSAFSSDIESITAGVTQPQLLLQKTIVVWENVGSALAAHNYNDRSDGTSNISLMASFVSHDVSWGHRNEGIFGT